MRDFFLCIEINTYMKNLKTFENYDELSPYFGFIKKYGDPYP
jgi:hypothetical protein